MADETCGYVGQDLNEESILQLVLYSWVLSEHRIAQLLEAELLCE